METQAQKLIDATTKAFTTQRMMAPMPGMMPPPVTAAAMGMMVGKKISKKKYLIFSLQPRPFVMPPGMMRPPMMPPMGVGPMPGAGFFPPPLPTGLPVPMPQSSVAPHPNIPIPVPTTSSNENGGGGMASIRTNIKME